MAAQDHSRARKLRAEAQERELRLAINKRELASFEEVREVEECNAAEAKDLLRNKFEVELCEFLKVCAEAGGAVDAGRTS